MHWKNYLIILVDSVLRVWGNRNKWGASNNQGFFVLLKRLGCGIIEYMRREFFAFLLVLVAGVSGASAAFTSCGAGYVLVESRQKIDGIKTAECQKLWCRDLETGKMMGNGTKVNSGYIATSGPEKLCDADGNCIECWGQRRWCAGEVRGDWYPEYGAYTRGGNNTYQSYQKGSCFAWRLRQPDCPDGQDAILQNEQWVCVTPSNTAEAVRSSTIRRTGTLRRLRR